MSVLILGIFAGFLAWGIKSGQFKNTEEAKYQMFRTEDTQGQDKEAPEKPVKKEVG